MRVLAIDHGLARAGTAISDPSGTLATPLGVIEPPSAERAAALAVEHGAELILLGMPVSLSGEEGEQTARVREFAVELAGLTEVPVETFDERLTTRMANASARAGASAPPDALAAAHLLEGWLDARRARDEAER